MAPDTAPPMFNDLNIKQIVGSVGKLAKEHKVAKLPQVLVEWAMTDLSEHLSRETPKITAKRRKHLAAVSKQASKLLLSLEQLDEDAELAIAVEMVRQSDQQFWKVPPTEVDSSRQRLAEEHDFLKRLVAVTPRALGRPKRGHPRNLIADLILCDAAAIFSWLTEIEPTRKVDREGRYSKDSYEYGPFWDFAGALWPVIFEKSDDGLQAAIRRWADAVDFKSPLIANINMRHPLWRLFAKK
jgi:hypothetical protein